MTTKSIKRTTLIAAAVLVVVVAIAVVAYLLGRSSSAPPPESPNSAPVSSVSTAGSPTPTYAPTDQNGSPEPGLARGLPEAGRGGTETGPANLPLGYSHDETGAVEAATNYLTWMNSLKITDKGSADAMATAAAADPETRTALVNSFDMLRSGMKGTTGDQPEPARGAYAVASLSANRALVYIWAPEVSTDSGGQTSHLWAIDAVPLIWTSGDWKLDKALIARAGAAAVDPGDPAGNPTAEEKHSILTRTPANPGEITDSASQTWFEYANAPR